ncbi:MAG: mannose-6-phosphate isomerase, class I [Acidimicrobiia bacterium]|nr:mannose-6-phosphate isomerase, class I [Acidimicrobiia bacterium]
MERLTGITQRYAWGSHTLLATLRGLEPSDDPEAEIWYGAHDAAPSVLDGGQTLISDIEADPKSLLGNGIVREHGAKLPFLLKLLAVGEPLSIQAHPTAEQAAAGFERENAAGILIGAPNRSFRDDAPKPELIAALTPFEALVGFRPVPRTLDYLASIGAHTLQHVLRERGLLATVRWALAPTADERASVETAVDELVLSAGRDESIEWHLEAQLVSSIAKLYPGDAGLLIAALLNRVLLEPGEALYLDAGTLHSYVSGLGVEIMGNSDNVLRGGLTKKNTDAENLLEVLRDEASEVEVITPDGDGTYQTPAREFLLSTLTAESKSITGPAIVLAIDGEVTILCDGRTLVLAPTEAVWLSAADSATAETNGRCFVAEVPHQ